MVNVITVTYGNRWEYLSQILNFLLNCKEVSLVVVIDNNSSYNLSEKISAYPSDKIIIHKLKENKGSAFGFKKGIQIALEKGKGQFLLLLDDDNLPENSALECLIEKWGKQNAKSKELFLALSGFRPARKYHYGVLKGISIDRLFPHRNSFLGFDLFELPVIVINKISQKGILERENLIRETIIPMAPYGGLFFHRDLIDKIGLPDERFFVYADDFEFTYRITKSGGTILLTGDCRIKDLEQTWLLKTKHGFFHPRYLEQKDFKTYYAVRNATYFSVQNLVTSKWRFHLNKSIYLAYLFFMAALYGKQHQFKRVVNAVNDGIQGKFDQMKMIGNR